MDIKVKKKDVLWSYLGTVFSLGSNFIVLPFMLIYLSNEQIGIYSVFISLSAIAQLFSLGFGPCFARNIAYCWCGAKELKKKGVVVTENAGPNFDLLKPTLVACKVIYGFLSFLSLLCIGIIGTNYITTITACVTGINHLIAWGIFVIALFLNLFLGYYSTFLQGIGDIHDVNKCTIISKCIQIALTIVFLISGLQLIAYSIGFLICGITFRGAAKHYFNKYCNIKCGLKESTVIVNKKVIFNTLKIIWPNAWRDGLVSLANYLLNQASTVIVSLYLPLTETGVYSLTVQLVTAIVTIAATLYNTYQPALQSASVQDDKEAMKKYLSVIVVMYTLTFIIGAILLIIVVLPILKYIKPDYVFSISVILIAGLYQYILKLRNCYATYFSSTNRVIYVKAFVVSAVICIGFSYVAINVFYFGVLGLIIAQILSQLIYNAWYWPLKAHKEMGLNVFEMPGYCYSEIRLLFIK